MGTDIIETREFNGVVYRILLLDNKYTVYVKDVKPKTDQEKQKEEFSAVASFDSLIEARNYVEDVGRDSKSKKL